MHVHNECIVANAPQPFGSFLLSLLLCKHRSWFLHPVVIASKDSARENQECEDQQRIASEKKVPALLNDDKEMCAEEWAKAHCRDGGLGKERVGAWNQQIITVKTIAKLEMGI